MKIAGLGKSSPQLLEYVQFKCKYLAIFKAFFQYVTDKLVIKCKKIS